jgi:F0F1-type ATP synthase assembly protein I
MMKAVFTKDYGKIVEKVELTTERKWVHLNYQKGSFQKSAFILKNDPDAVDNYTEKFFRDYNVSEELQERVKEIVARDKRHIDINFQQYLNLLVTSSSSHMVVGVTLALSILVGYKIGEYIDNQNNLTSTYTIIGVVLGMIFGIIVDYIMMAKNIGTNLKKEKPKLTKGNEHTKQNELPFIEPSLNDVSVAINKFSRELPKGIHRDVLINNDNSIDFMKLVPYLGGLPTKQFYMSKETYEIFEEEDKDLAVLIDKVQRAVYTFYKKHNEYPIMPYDPYRTVNYYQLVQGKYLLDHPKITLYVTENNGLVTHIKPFKKHARA